MPLLVTSNEDLKAMIPNVMTAAVGESSLFDKIISYIDAAEDFLSEHLVGSEMIEAAASGNPKFAALRSRLRRLVAIRAFLSAVPALDLILTPNGFGVVRNQNISPASVQRTEALKDGLREQQDNLFFSILSILKFCREWHQSAAAADWGSSIFQSASVVDRICPDHKGSVWDKFFSLRPALMAAENDLALKVVSPQLMVAMRKSIMSGMISIQVGSFVNYLTDAVISVYCGKKKPADIIDNVVDLIRSEPELYDIWKNTPQGASFSPNVFVNDPLDAGYFF